MDQKKHWNGIATRYEDEIFDVFQSDKNGILSTYFKKHANRSHQAIDFGCGVGKAFQYLSPSFNKTLAIDISAKCLAIAKQNSYSNINYRRLDLSRKNLRLTQAEFVFCCNVIMLPQIEKNEEMFKNIQRSLKKGGHALIVIPAMESILFSSWRLIDWYRKEGVKPSEISSSELNYFKGSKVDILRGLVHINGVPTKHYSYPELEILFKSAGLNITAIEKLEYEWNTEFSSPPQWMQSPFPWDWLVECKRLK
jgi:SAM-dependent methyltransferase